MTCGVRERVSRSTEYDNYLEPKLLIPLISLLLCMRKVTLKA